MSHYHANSCVKKLARVAITGLGSCQSTRTHSRRFLAETVNTVCLLPFAIKVSRTSGILALRTSPDTSTTSAISLPGYANAFASH